MDHEEGQAQFDFGSACMEGTLDMLTECTVRKGTERDEQIVISTYFSILSAMPSTVAPLAGLHRGIEIVGDTLGKVIALTGVEVLDFGIKAEMLNDDADAMDHVKLAEIEQYAKVVLRMIMLQARGDHDGVHAKLQELTEPVKTAEAAVDVALHAIDALFVIERQFRTNAVVHTPMTSVGDLIEQEMREDG